MSAPSADAVTLVPSPPATGTPDSPARGCKTPPPTTSQLPQSTPVRFTQSNALSHNIDSTIGHKRNAEDVMGRIGRVNYKKFLAEWVPGPDPTPKEEEAFSKFERIQRPELKVREKEIYARLAEGMQTAFVKKKLAIKITADRSTASNGPRVDLSIYPRVDGKGPVPTNFDLTDDDKDNSQVKDPEYLDCSARMSWHDVIVPIEVKPSTQPPAFKFTPAKGKSTIESLTEGGEVIRGQMAGYVSCVQYHQHRNFLFSIYIHGADVFLIRWDRVGAVVCEPFDLQKESMNLLRFLYRLEKMTPAQLGYDPTVVPASAEEIKKFQDFVPQNDHHKACQKEALDEAWTRYKVDIDAWQSPDRLHLVIGKPRFTSHSAVGRGTKGFVAFDLDNNRLVFLKDYWRSGSNDSRAELEVYKKLTGANVRHIATPIGGGDVGPEQRTMTEKYITTKADSRVHYRFAVRQVGRPLTTYQTAREMVRFIYHAVIAHKLAWENAEVLHRDISCANILIDDFPDNPQLDSNRKPIPQGFLNDWDLCKFKSELAGSATQANRSGTWVFMSGLLLRYPTKPHKLSDDLESFVHLINWLTIRYHKAWPNIHDLNDLLAAVYEKASRTDNGYDVGSDIKLRFMQNGEPGFDTTGVPVGLSELVKSLAGMCKEHLSSIDYEADIYPYAIHGQGVSEPPIVEEPEPPIEEWDEIDVCVEDDAHHEVPQNTYKVIKARGRPVMDKHDKICALLRMAGRPDAKLWVGPKKLPDQFAILPPIKPGCLTGAGGSTKRSSQVLDDDGGSKSKKPRTTSDASFSRSLRSSGPLRV